MLALLAALHVILWITLLSNLYYLRPRTASASCSTPEHVSILIPARNEAQNLERLLPSILKQQHRSYEVIIFDDASTDDTQEVLARYRDERLTMLRGEELPTGWVGKVHALYQATRVARGEVYLFLDADTELRTPHSLEELHAQFRTLPENSVMTGLTRLGGAGRLLVSLVPHTILSSIPWPLVPHVPLSSLAALNGQCWMIRAEHYHTHEPHAALRDEVLEDVQAGRYLKRKGIPPYLIDVQQQLRVYMYADFKDAWQGFRKNVYLVMGGRLLPFLLNFGLFFVTYLLAPFYSLWFLVSLFGLKAITDWRSGFSPGLSLLAPFSFAAACLLQLDSAYHHLSGNVSWKDRQVV